MAIKPDNSELFIGVSCSGIITRSFATGTLCIYTAMEPDKVTGNEDAAAMLVCDEHSGALVIADGLGGSPEGGKASAIAVEELYNAISRVCPSDTTMREPILDGIEQANRSILDMGNGSATTIIVVEVSGSSIRAFHVGDSMALVTGQKGKIKYQSIPHSPVGYAIESGLMHEDDAMHHDDRHIISNMVGSHEMRLEMGPLMDLSKRDTLILGSDGLFDNLTIDEIVNIIRCGRLEHSAEKLLATCTRRMTQYVEGELHKPDDLTFILFRPG